MTRTQQEITTRIDDLTGVIRPHWLGEDVFGYRRQVLVGALDFEHARPYLADGVTAERWDAERYLDLDAAARAYYDFALTKIENHRGISAARSVVKLGEFAWLLGRDDATAAMDAARYDQYGAPKVAAFGQALGLDWPDEPWARRMAAGQPCAPGCWMGCGQ